MRKVFLCLVFLLFAILAARSQEAEGYLCRVHPKVESGMSAVLPVDLVNFTFFGSLEDSVGYVEIVNNTTKTIRHYVIVFDLVDSAGNHIVTVPVFNIDKDQHLPFDVGFKDWAVANWPGGHFDPIRPKTKSRKSFLTPLTVLSCPTTARIAVIHLRYDDGTEFHSSSSNIVTQPLITEPAIGDAAGYQHWAPLANYGTIRIDSTGNAHLNKLNNQTGEFEQWFGHELTAWKFVPALNEGKPVSGEIPFVLIIGDPTKLLRAQIESLKEKGEHQAVLVLVAVPPGSSFGNTWAVSAGGLVVVASKRRPPQ
jgi:hypothetical protein